RSATCRANVRINRMGTLAPRYQRSGETLSDLLRLPIITSFYDEKRREDQESGNNGSTTLGRLRPGRNDVVPDCERHRHDERQRLRRQDRHADLRPRQDDEGRVSRVTAGEREDCDIRRTRYTRAMMPCAFLVRRG